MSTQSTFSRRELVSLLGVTSGSAVVTTVTAQTAVARSHEVMRAATSTRPQYYRIWYERRILQNCAVNNAPRDSSVRDCNSGPPRVPAERALARQEPGPTIEMNLRAVNWQNEANGIALMSWQNEANPESVVDGNCS